MLQTHPEVDWARGTSYRHLLGHVVPTSLKQVTMGYLQGAVEVELMSGSSWAIQRDQLALVCREIAVS